MSLIFNSKILNINEITKYLPPFFNFYELFRLEPVYEENSCFYIFSKKTNQLVKNRLGSNPMMFALDRLEAVDIDDIEDFYWAEYLLNQKLQNAKR